MNAASAHAGCQQDPVLFNDTVRNNIAYGRPEATLDEIKRAALAANAHPFIAALPDRYQTILGERGNRLSVGERQRIAIARALVKTRPCSCWMRPRRHWTPNPKRWCRRR